MDKKEILRYLRTSSKVRDDRLYALIDSCIGEVEKSVNPKTIYRIFDCTVTDNELIIGEISFNSARLAENLRGCKKVALIGATLGTESDRLLRISEATEIAKASVIQAVLSAKIEEICDELEAEIISKNGVKLRQRYSPGYYDLTVENQINIFNLIDITKRIGVTLTDTMQMIPTKSVTAIIGIDYED